jgi:hypothetical protein
MMSGCASAPPIQTTDSACRDWQPITYAWAPACELGDPENRCDSVETVEQVEIINAYMEGVCQ